MSETNHWCKGIGCDHPDCLKRRAPVPEPKQAASDEEMTVPLWELKYRMMETLCANVISAHKASEEARKKAEKEIARYSKHWWMPASRHPDSSAVCRTCGADWNLQILEDKCPVDMVAYIGKLEALRDELVEALDGLLGHCDTPGDEEDETVYEKDLRRAFNAWSKAKSGGVS